LLDLGRHHAGPGMGGDAFGQQLRRKEAAAMRRRGERREPAAMGDEVHQSVDAGAKDVLAHVVAQLAVHEARQPLAIQGEAQQPRQLTGQGLADLGCAPGDRGEARPVLTRQRRQLRQAAQRTLEGVNVVGMLEHMGDAFDEFLRGGDGRQAALVVQRPGGPGRYRDAYGLGLSRRRGRVPQQALQARLVGGGDGGHEGAQLTACLRRQAPGFQALQHAGLHDGGLVQQRGDERLRSRLRQARLALHDAVE
jgi:hypothetical protein